MNVHVSFSLRLAYSKDFLLARVDVAPTESNCVIEYRRVVNQMQNYSDSNQDCLLPSVYNPACKRYIPYELFVFYTLAYYCNLLPSSQEALPNTH